MAAAKRGRPSDVRRPQAFAPLTVSAGRAVARLARALAGGALVAAALLSVACETVPRAQIDEARSLEPGVRRFELGYSPGLGISASQGIADAMDAGAQLDLHGFATLSAWLELSLADRPLGGPSSRFTSRPARRRAANDGHAPIAAPETRPRRPTAPTGTRPEAPAGTLTRRTAWRYRRTTPVDRSLPMSDPRQHVVPPSTGITRRELLLGSAALTLTALAPRAFGQDASVEGIARRTVGEHELIALLDGRLTLDPGLFAGASDEELAALIGSAPLSGYINAFVVRSPGGVVMIDAGAGSLFGPTAGATTKLLAAAEIDPADVDTFYVTHLHGDHVGALIGDDPLSLPNAQMVLHERERAFWFDDAIMAQAGEQMAPFFEAARAAVGTFGERVTTFAGADVPGPLTAMELFGHTPGHTGYIVADGDDTVLVWGDIVHAPALQFPRPDVTIAFDVDQDVARATRERLLDTVATDGVVVAGMHLVFPALGTVTRATDGYAFETDG